MVPVDEGEIEAPALGEEAREDELRALAVELDELPDARLLEDLQTHAGVARRQLRRGLELIRVDGDVPGVRAAGEQSFADEERRHGVPEARLERPPRSLPAHPVRERGTLLAPVGAADDAPGVQERLPNVPHPPGERLPRHARD